MKPQCRHAVRLLATALAVPLLSHSAGAEEPADAPVSVEERLEQQEREIDALQEQVDDLLKQVAPPPQHPEYEREDGDRPLTDYLNPQIRLDVAAQVHPAMNIAGDGRDTEVYFVDNDATASRVRMAGVGTFAQGPQLGTTLEIGFSPNNSFDVSQDNQLAGDFISVRRAEVWVRDDRFGRLMFGRGSAASDNAAEFDLSLVSGTIMTSGASFVAGGLQFVSNGALTGTTVADSFFNFDGNRENRARYDTPMFGPFQLPASVGANQSYGGALTFGGDYDHWTGKQLGGFTTLGAVTLYDPNVPGLDFRMAGSWSMLHDASGLSATFSSGFDEVAAGSRPYNVYGKLGWDTNLCDQGDTGFGVDYTWTENVSGVGDQGQSVGFAVVQVIDRFGTQIYSQFRWYSVDRAAGPRFDDIFLGTVGALVRF